MQRDGNNLKKKIILIIYVYLNLVLSVLSKVDFFHKSSEKSLKFKLSQKTTVVGKISCSLLSKEKK